MTTQDLFRNLFRQHAQRQLPDAVLYPQGDESHRYWRAELHEPPNGEVYLKIVHDSGVEFAAQHFRRRRTDQNAYWHGTLGRMIRWERDHAPADQGAVMLRTGFLHAIREFPRFRDYARVAAPGDAVPAAAPAAGPGDANPAQDRALRPRNRGGGGVADVPIPDYFQIFYSSTEARRVALRSSSTAREACFYP